MKQLTGWLGAGKLFITECVIIEQPLVEDEGIQGSRSETPLTPPSAVDGRREEPERWKEPQRGEGVKSTGNKLQAWKQLVSCRCDFLRQWCNAGLTSLWTDPNSSPPGAFCLVALWCGQNSTGGHFIGTRSQCSYLSVNVSQRGQKAAVRLRCGPEKSLIHPKLWCLHPGVKFKHSLVVG